VYNDVSYQGPWVARGNLTSASYSSFPVIQRSGLNAQHPELPAKRVSPRTVSEAGRRKTKASGMREVPEAQVSWEALLSDGWTAYADNISREIEKVYRRTRSKDLQVLEEKTWWQNRLFFYKFKQYIISPHFMLQRNTKTGKDRQIRRKKIEQISKVNVEKRVSPRRAKGVSKGKPSMYANSSVRKVSPRGVQPKQRGQKRRVKPAKRGNGDGARKPLRKNRKDHPPSKSEDSTDTINFSNCRKWKTAHVVSWLRILNFPQYCDIVQQKGITGKMLSKVSITYLVTELNMSVEHATHIFGALEGIKSGFMDKKEKTVRKKKNKNIQTVVGGKKKARHSREMKLSLMDFSIGDENSGERGSSWKGSQGAISSVPSRKSDASSYEKVSKFVPASSVHIMDDSHNLFNIDKVKSHEAESSAANKRETEINQTMDNSSPSKEVILHNFEKGTDFALSNIELKNNIERLKLMNWHNYHSSIYQAAQLGNPLVAKEQSMSSNMTQEIHDSSSMSSSEGDLWRQESVEQLSKVKAVNREEKLDDEFGSAPTSETESESLEHDLSGQHRNQAKFDKESTPPEEPSGNNLTMMPQPLTSMQLEHVEIESNLSVSEGKVADEMDREANQVNKETNHEDARNLGTDSIEEDARGLVFSLNAELRNPESIGKMDGIPSSTESEAS